MIGLPFGQRPRDLLAIILTHRKHLSMQRWGRHRHCRQWRPSRILAWLQQTRVSGSHHHINSSYLEQPPQESKNAQELGSLHEAGRATAQFTPPIWRDCSGNKNPAQSHHKSASQNSSLENRSIPSLLKKSKNRRGYRSEAAHLSRLERERDKRAKRRREARNIKSRWKGLPREDLEIVLHLGTPGLRDGNMLQETPMERDRDRTERQPPLPPPQHPPSSPNSQGSAPEQQTVSSYPSSSSHSTSDTSSSSSSPSSSASSSSASSSSLPACLALTTSFAKSEGPETLDGLSRRIRIERRSFRKNKDKKSKNSSPLSPRMMKTLCRNGPQTSKLPPYSNPLHLGTRAMSHLPRRCQEP